MNVYVYVCDCLRCLRWRINVYSYNELHTQSHGKNYQGLNTPLGNKEPLANAGKNLGSGFDALNREYARTIKKQYTLTLTRCGMRMLDVATL